MMKVLASVAIPTYKRPEYLIDALQSVIAQETDFSFDVFVVDNGCDDALAARVEEIGRQAPIPVRYIPVAEIGLHHCRHAAAFAAQGEVLVYVDDDVIAPPGWLAAMAAPFRDPLVACVGGKTVPKWEAEPPEWLEQFGGNGSGYLSLLDLGGTPRPMVWPETAFGCNMAVRRRLIFEMGGFHPDGIADRKQIWWRGDGETGLNEKVYRAGMTIVYSPHAWLYHRISASRLHPEYFYWRAFIQGISDSYTYARAGYPTTVKLLRHTARCVLRTIRCWWRAKRCQDRSIWWRAQAHYWWGRAQHHGRVAVNPVLRRHVFEANYLSASGLTSTMSLR